MAVLVVDSYLSMKNPVCSGYRWSGRVVSPSLPVVWICVDVSFWRDVIHVGINVQCKDVDMLQTVHSRIIDFNLFICWLSYRWRVPLVTGRKEPSDGEPTKRFLMLHVCTLPLKSFPLSWSWWVSQGKCISAMKDGVKLTPPRLQLPSVYHRVRGRKCLHTHTVHTQWESSF